MPGKGGAMRGNFPNSLIFIIAAGVFFVAGSYALFGISGSTGEPRFLNWVPYERPQNTFVEKRTLALQTALGETLIVFDNTAPFDIVNRFLGNASGGYRTFAFTALHDGSYLEASMQLPPQAPVNEAELFPKGTVAIGRDAGTGEEKLIVLVKEAPLPGGYVAVGSVSDEGGTLDAIASLPAREDGLIIDGAPVISARPGMQYEQPDTAVPAEVENIPPSADAE